MREALLKGTGKVAQTVGITESQEDFPEKEENPRQLSCLES